MFKREKMVGRRLSAGGVEAYVPIKTEVRHYKTKTRTVELPLFSSYVFARITGAEYAQVLRDPDVFEIVRFNGEVGRVTDEEIAFLKLVLRESGEKYDPQLVEGMAVGTPVVISGGTLAGTRGVIMAEKSNSNFVVELRTPRGEPRDHGGSEVPGRGHERAARTEARRPRRVMVTVVTVTLNAAPALGVTIASLRHQDRSAFEWIVVDGGSADATAELCAASGLEPAWFDLPGSSIYGAMNFGVRQARGGLVYFLNAGDALSEGFRFAEVLSLKRAHPRAFLFYGNVHRLRTDSIYDGPFTPTQARLEKHLPPGYLLRHRHAGRTSLRPALPRERRLRPQPGAVWPCARALYLLPRHRRRVRRPCEVYQPRRPRRNVLARAARLDPTIFGATLRMAGFDEAVDARAGHDPAAKEEGALNVGWLMSSLKQTHYPPHTRLGNAPYLRRPARNA